MAYTQSDLQNLQTAIAKGAVEVQIGGERVRYRSLEEMFKLEAKIKEALGKSAPRRRVHYPQTRSGLR